MGEAKVLSRYITAEVRRHARKRDGNKCVYCGDRGKRRRWQFWKKPLEYGHVVPYSSGGMNCAENIQMECFSCNRSKGAQTISLHWIKRWLRKEAQGCTVKRCKHIK